MRCKFAAKPGQIESSVDLAHQMIFRDRVAKTKLVEQLTLAYLRKSWLRPDRSVYAVNPTRPEVQGERSYPSVSAIGTPVDLAIIAVPAARIEEATADCCEAGCKAAIIFSSGFGELGEDGKRRQQRLHQMAAEAGMRLLGPNCLGIIDVPNGLYATFSEAARDQNHAPGAISVASQSGAVAAQFLMLGRRLGVGMNKLISTGNEQDIDVAEAIAYLAADDMTKVIVAYLEGCKAGDRLVEALKQARAKRKPVITVKVGRSATGSRATLSHTGSLAGEDRIFDAVFRQYGAYRVDSFDEAMDVAVLCASAGAASGNRVGLLSISGGVGALMADAAEAAGLDVAPIPESAAADALRAKASFSTLQNPLDITAQAINDMSLWRSNLEAMLAGRRYDALIAFLTFVGESPKMFDRVIDSMAEVKAAYLDVPIIFCSLCSPAARLKAAKNGFLVFEDAIRAVRAVAGWARLGVLGARADNEHPGHEGAAIAGDASVNEFEAKRQLARVGISVPLEQLVNNRDEAMAAARHIGFPVVLKICSADLPHKTEVGGVALNLADVEAVGKAYDRITANAARHAPAARIDGVIVAEQVGRGVEMILGTQRDPLFGTMVMLGFGGIHVEVVKDVALRRAPLTEADVDDMIASLNGKALLGGFRGQPASDIPALRNTIIRLADAAGASSAQSIEINPLLVRQAGNGVVALDCLIEAATA